MSHPPKKLGVGVTSRHLIPPLLLLALLIAAAAFVAAVPEGPSATYQETRNATGAANYTMNMTGTAGGNIFVYNLSATQLNLRWKGYVGAISGALRLADGNGVLYEWGLGTDFTAEVYATRTPNPISWNDINCTWAKTGDGDTTNRSNEEEEGAALNFDQTMTIDNISATFPTRDNVGFQAGSVYIAQDTCYTTNAYSNSADTEGYFEEVLLHDGTYLVYAAVMNKTTAGYDGGLYDYEMIIPENADPTWPTMDLSTAYYFYLELA